MGESMEARVDHVYETFDFGPGWCVIGAPWPNSRPAVVIHLEARPLSARDCRKLAEWLCESADWLDGYEAHSSDPIGPVVYAITDGAGHHKIGKAVDFSKRVKQLQTGNGRRLSLVAYLQCSSDQVALRAESAAHKSLHDCKACGEWFECNSHFAFQALHEAAIACRLDYGPVDVRVGHDQEAMDGR